MANMLFKTKGDAAPNGKPRVFFTCHPADFEKYFGKICADIFVDATGDIVFARDAGCKYAIGTEGKEDYNEPSARTKTELVNGATFVFRIRKVPDNNHIDQSNENTIEKRNDSSAFEQGFCSTSSYFPFFFFLK